MATLLSLPKGGRVEIEAQQQESEVIVRVADTGIGIAPNKRDRIFESFTQAEGNTRREYGGVGLGLSVTKKLIELHEGEIWVDSVMGRGSQFSFTLPLATETEERAEISIDDSVGNLTIEPQIPSTARSFNPKNNSTKVLIVDDDPANLQVLINNLSLADYDIAQASNGIGSSRTAGKWLKTRHHLARCDDAENDGGMKLQPS